MNIMCQIGESSLSSYYSDLLSSSGATSVTIVLSADIAAVNVANFDAFFFSIVDSTAVANKVIEAFNSGKKIAFGAYSGTTNMLSGLGLGAYVDSSGIAVDRLATAELSAPFNTVQNGFEIRSVSGYLSAYTGIPSAATILNKVGANATSFLALKINGFSADALFVGWLPWSSTAPTLTTDGENYLKAMLTRWMQLEATDKFVSGYVTDDLGNPLIRTVRLYRRDTGALLSETTSNASGFYLFTTTHSSELYVICVGGIDKNSQIKDKIIAQ